MILARNLLVLFPLGLVLSLYQLFKVKTSLFEWKHCHISLKWWSFHPIPLFERKKGIIWWLFHDDLRAREREEKGTTNTYHVFLGLVKFLSEYSWVKQKFVLKMKMAILYLLTVFASKNTYCKQVRKCISGTYLNPNIEMIFKLLPASYK